MINYLIGNTPMIKINYKYKNKINYVFVKLEYYNFSGSIKDRVAYYIINDAIKNGLLKDGMPIVEATSGNTGIAISALGAYYKHPVYIFMPDWVSKERKSILEMYGAKVILISKEEGGFKEAVRRAKEFARDNNGFYANQFSNYSNVLAHYETTGKEIVSKIDVDGFISGIGTGGTLIGIGKRIKKNNSKASIWALEPENMSLLKTGKVTSHKIDGIGDEFIPDIVDRSIIDNIVLINDDDAINMSKKIAKELGIGVGISSGANLIASVIMHEEVNGNIVTVFPDDSKKYLSTDLSKENNLSNKYISNKIELINFEIIK